MDLDDDDDCGDQSESDTSAKSNNNHSLLKVAKELVRKEVQVDAEGGNGSESDDDEGGYEDGNDDLPTIHNTSSRSDLRTGQGATLVSLT